MKMPNVSPASRVMIVAILVSMVAFLDGTIVNLALPATERDLGGGLALQQWIVDGYFLTLAAMILPGGSISDLFGRIPVMRFGLAAFGTGALLAATAVSPAMMIAGRLVQGFGGAFLVPGSLALINSAFESAKRPAAIGIWTAWTGTAFALGPVLGGLTVDSLSWRWIYILTAIPVVIGFALTFWLGPTSQSAEHGSVDVVGAALSATGLAATVYALIESQRRGLHNPLIVASTAVGIAALLAFVAWERGAPHPMIPLQMFTIRNFAGANLTTAFVYGGLAIGSIGIALYLQEVVGYPAITAGLVTLPTPIVSLLFARRVGDLAARVGPRLFLMAGPALAGLGLLLIHPSTHRFNLFTQVLPGIILVAAGLVLTLTPLTSLNLSSVKLSQSGIAAAMQNAVGRTSALIAVGSVGVIAAGALTDASAIRLLQVGGVMMFIGAVISGVLVTNPPLGTDALSDESDARMPLPESVVAGPVQPVRRPGTTRTLDSGRKKAYFFTVRSH